MPALDMSFQRTGPPARQGRKMRPHRDRHDGLVLTAVSAAVLPRKEVIQPHLPVRLPCYDFTPITDPTFDSCLPCGLAHRLRVLPTFVV